MKIAITGATGFIGSKLARHYHERGATVHVLSRQGTMPLEENIKVFQRDLSKVGADELVGFVDGCDIVYHCSAEIRNHAVMYATNVGGTQKLIEAATGRVGRWVQLSSTGVYGSRRNGVVTEQTVLNPCGKYETSKVESDAMVVAAALSGAFEYSILRPSNVFGPSMTNQSLFQMIEMINKGFFFFIGKPGASANYIHVDNVVEGLVQCGKKDAARGRIYNLSDHRTIEDFVAVVTDELRKPEPKLRLPEMPVRWVARMCERLPHFPLTESRVNALTNRSMYSIERIQHELEYTYQVSMEDGLLQMVKVWKQAT